MFAKKPLTLTAIVLSVALTASCTRLPTNTEPQALRPFDPQSTAAEVVAPIPGREADLLLRDFYAAGAVPAGDYEAARSYLTPAARDVWNPSESVLIVDRIDLNTQPGGNNQRRSLSVRGNVIGALEEGGAFVPEAGVYEATVELEQVGGEWRISSLPSGIIMERNELRNQYQPFNIYFAGKSSNVIVGDRRWVYSGRDSLDTVIMSLITAGPSERLAPAVENILPPDAAFTGKSDGIYEFSNMASMDTEKRTQFAGQVVWTLAMAGVSGPYKLNVDGAPILGDKEELTTDDFASMNPQTASNDVAKLYALTNGDVHEVSGGEVTRLEGELGSEGNVSSVEISSDGGVAAVLKNPDNEEEQIFAVGNLSGKKDEVLRARTISRPSFEQNSNVAWVVVDGTKVVRAVQSTDSGDIVSSEVGTPFLEDIGGEISMLRLSRTGSRAAMIIDGRLFIGIVERTRAGERSIVNVMEYATELSGAAVSVDWNPDGSLVVGTSSPDSPVKRVELDGSSVTAYPSGNINGPVVAVSAGPTMIYATDANALLQLPTTGTEYTNWREVPGLQGVRSAPVVAK
ncbi:MtrAB system accessory lipoprotein LpqB [Corynebacterium breve]|uniref:Lipoprotein LpqB n=1 Tax=Corynebacterium breve TaxID=3049799 RepID=A0ABY8VJA6_9CORY|nr:MtrAB system accessory lipoprotein LpqB [Corynebacterium breve]WIM68269.1 MtrAB system accessory lipoprotein LpqB [Corynebacterium breve]